MQSKWMLSVIVLILLTISSVLCIPISPCPMNFHYEYDGENWFGVARVFPQIYNRFRTNKITINLSLTVSSKCRRHQCNIIQLKYFHYFFSLTDLFRI